PTGAPPPSARPEPPSETGAERAPAHGTTDVGDAIGVERGLSSIEGIGIAEPIEHAPPAAALPLSATRLQRARRRGALPLSQMRRHAGMQPPRKLTQVDPISPPVAQSARIEGT